MPWAVVDAGPRFSLYRASDHDVDASDALGVPALLGRADATALHGLIKVLGFNRSIIAVRGPAGSLTSALAQAGLTPSWVDKSELDARANEAEARP